MKRATLLRLEHGFRETVGLFILDGEIICFMLEDPDQDNAPAISRIPEGRYTCNRVLSPQFGDTFEISDVPDREYIRFHWGNTHLDTRGCPLTGSEVGWFEDGIPKIRAVLESKKAFHRFMDCFEGEEHFELNVISILHF